MSDPAALGPWAELADVTLGLGSLHLRTKLSEGGKKWKHRRQSRGCDVM